MKVSGFTFLRNGTLMGYPYIESIRSLLPLVDEFVVNIGEGRDDTYEQVAAINDPKLRIIRSHWNESMHSRGFVYAQQKMIAQFNCTGDWAFYLEGDEVVHENDLDRIHGAMQKHLGNPGVEALAFHYHHFYGQPGLTANSPAWYRNEVRIIRNSIRSYAPDGLFWMVMPSHRRGRYPYAAHTGAHIYHYGHVRSSKKMEEKMRNVAKYWDGTAPASFDYGNVDKRILQAFAGTHPAAVQAWLLEHAERDFAIVPGYQPSKRDQKHQWLMKLERLLNQDFSKKHYKLVKD